MPELETPSRKGWRHLLSPGLRSALRPDVDAPRICARLLAPRRSPLRGARDVAHRRPITPNAAGSRRSPPDLARARQFRAKSRPWRGQMWPKPAGMSGDSLSEARRVERKQAIFSAPRPGPASRLRLFLGHRGRRLGYPHHHGIPPFDVIPGRGTNRDPGDRNAPCGSRTQEPRRSPGSRVYPSLPRGSAGDDGEGRRAG
jgi:hypothetical protein